MSNPQFFEDSADPLILAQDALNKLVQIGLAQTSPKVQAGIQAAMENGARITLEAELSPEPVYRFFLQREDGAKINLCVIFMDDHNQTVPEPSH